MKKIDEIYQDLRNLEFPYSPSNELLDDIFVDLVQFRNFIAGSIDKLLKRKSISMDEIGYNFELESELKDFIKEAKSDEDIETANSYLIYMENLKKIIENLKTL